MAILHSDTATQFRRGLVHGIPIALGYLSVSIGFGLLAVSGGLTIGQSLLISMTNLTSAGQLAGVQVMFSGGSLLEMAITQLFINLRYALMSITLSQRLADDVCLPERLGIGFFVTDEVFAVSSSQPETLSKRYMCGLVLLPYLGWALGTLLGAIAGATLPPIIRDGLGIMIYGMFIAIIVPPARESRPIRLTVLIAIALRCAFQYMPGLRTIPGGFAIVLCAVLASVVCAIRYPIRGDIK
ncbi:AzlC family ABC transporter permease [Eubacteriales bacterium OttesenSCG-928-A19]|nr:AzlC family ABC transporter permease [Eubacteriales bacterium OttesenSCG-928-A19]